MKAFSRLARLRRITGAFLWMGFKQELAYPLSLAMETAGSLLPAVMFFFVAKIVDRSGPSVGGDYYTFVVIGIMAMRMLSAGLQGFGRELQRAVNQGRFEMLLLEPISWRFLPLGMTVWMAIERLVSTIAIFGVSLLLGARYDWPSLGIGLLILSLGLSASYAIGILSGSVMVLAKRSDPVVTLYTLAATILSGPFFPVDVLPGPLRTLSWVIPHTYVISGLRKVLMPQGETVAGLPVGETLLALIALNLVVFPLVLWIFGRSLEVGRRLGVLSGY